MLFFLFLRRFWKRSSENCPETRTEIANQHRKCQSDTVEVKKEKPKRKLFAECGRPYSLNEPKLEFRFEDLRDKFELHLHVHKWVPISDESENAISVKYAILFADISKRL